MCERDPEQAPLLGCGSQGRLRQDGGRAASGTRRRSSRSGISPLKSGHFHNPHLALAAERRRRRNGGRPCGGANVHLDKASGAKASPPKLDLVLRLLREGDTLKVTRLDRLSRSVLHLVTLGAELRERKIGLHVIEQGIDTDTMEGRAMFGMLSVLAELQRGLIVANTMDGLAAARARGRVGGRLDAGLNS
jgi:DNA invertase Pin-like site-specific DNA recombinase